MALSTIYSTNLSNYKPVIWYGKPVHKYSSQLKSFIGKNLGEEYKNLFTEPYISDAAEKGKTKAHWLSEYITSNAKPFTKLQSNKQEEVKKKLSLMLDKIDNFSKKLINSDIKNQIKLGEIIQTAIEVPSLEHVYVENNKISLVCWGFSSDRTETEKFKLRKTLNYYVPEIKEEEVIDTKEEDIIDIKKEEDVVDIKKEEDIVDIKKEEDIVDIKKEEDIVDIKKEEDIVDTKKDKTNFFKKYWWLFIIAGLFLLFLTIFLISNCDTNKNLPNEEGIIPPIDTTKIIGTPDGRKVISNQLNIWITNDSIPIENFADDFKKKYPNDNYKIVYFNKAMKRVRIKFPEKEKKNLKESLKKQFPKYNIIIFDEEIMRQNFTPSDPGFSDRNKSWTYEIIRAYAAWDINKGKPEIIVAIIDDGFDLNHPEFAGKIVNPFNVPMNNRSPNTGRTNMLHGTHVAGTAIGNMSNSSGVSGVAPGCSFMPVQVGDPLGNMSTTAIIDAVLYCISNGADVVNMSLGMPAPPGLSDTKQSTQKDLIEHTYKEQEKLWNELFEIADENDVTIVLAGGNDNVLIGIGAMGRTPFTINVSAVDSNVQKAIFSNYGDFSTVSAPGVQIYSSIPNNKYAFLDGTSMAAPVVTGAVALLKSINPELTTSEIKEILKKTGIIVNSPDKYVGELIQLDKALEYVEGGDINDCSDDVKEIIDSLYREIDKLKKLCDSTNSDNKEELIIPDDPKDFDFAKGRWKSSSELHDKNTKESIELYFDFYEDGTGKLTMKEANGNMCYASLKLETDKNILNIIQNEKAKCTDGKEYEIYKYQCVTTGKGAAVCNAKTKSDKSIVEFTLKRVH